MEVSSQLKITHQKTVITKLYISVQRYTQTMTFAYIYVILNVTFHNGQLSSGKLIVLQFSHAKSHIIHFWPVFLCHTTAALHAEKYFAIAETSGLSTALHDWQNSSKKN